MAPVNDKEKEEMREVPYQVAIGSLLYAAQTTRPDISFAVGTLSKFNSNPGREHWSGVKRVLRYLKGTKNAKIVYKRDGNSSLLGYADADHCDDEDDRKSISGYVFKLGDAIISWSSKKQQTVSLSTTESEYVALAHATKEALWLNMFSKELKVLSMEKPLIIYLDSKSALDLIKNPTYHARTKHIDIIHHFLRDISRNGKIEFRKERTELMVADSLTKAVNRKKHEWCRLAMGIQII